jgi:hypothetical protein
MEPTHEPVYEVVWPKSPRGVQPQRAATRLATLEGARIGLVWDHMFRGEELFPVLATELERRGATVVGWEAFGNVHGPDEHAVVAALPDVLRAERIDAVVVGNGC